AALDRRQQDLGGEPALGEDDRRDLLPQKPDGELRRFTKIRRADAELFVNDRRVVADEDLVPRGGAALRDFLDGLAPQPPRRLARIRDGRRGHDELRRRAVVAADAPETA